MSRPHLLAFDDDILWKFANIYIISDHHQRLSNIYILYEINAAIYLKENKCKIKSRSEYVISWLGDVLTRN